MDRYSRIQSIEEYRIANDLVLVELFPLKKKSMIISAGGEETDTDKHGLRVVKVNHTSESRVPDLQPGDIVLHCATKPINGFEYQSKKYFLMRSVSIEEYIPAEFYNCKIV